MNELEIREFEQEYEQRRKEERQWEREQARRYRRDPFNFGRVVWDDLGRIFGHPEWGSEGTLTYANEKWYHRPFIALALWTHEAHNFHEFRLGGQGYCSIYYCHWPLCWLLYRICEVVLKGRFVW